MLALNLLRTQPMNPLPKQQDLRKIKACPAERSIQQPLLHGLLRSIPWQLQQIYTRARARQPALIITRVSDTKPRIQATKTQQRSVGRAGDELEHRSALTVGEALHNAPEQVDGWMQEAVVADLVDAAVLRVGLEVGDGDAGCRAADEGLQLRLIEHA